MAGTAWANTFWMRNGNAQTPNENDFANSCASFHAVWLQHFLEHISIECTVLGTEGLYYDAVEAVVGFSYAETDTGSYAGAGLPAQVSTGISWAVQTHYKGGHPRTYLPPPSILALVSAREFTPAHANAVSAAANGFLSTANGITHGAFNSVHLGTVSFVLRKEWRAPPVFRDFVPGAASCDARVDTQRRRLGRDL